MLRRPLQQLVCLLSLAVLAPISGPTAKAQFPPPPVQQLGNNPIFGPMCSIPPGPPGPCRVVERHARVLQAMSGIQVQQIGMGPMGPICNGPLGPGHCGQVQYHLAMLQVARQEFPLRQTGVDPRFGPICLGPLGLGPCDAILIYLMQNDGMSSPAPIPHFAPSQVQLASGGSGPQGMVMCNTSTGTIPCNLVGQMALDRMGGGSPFPGGPPVNTGLPIQQLATQCAQRSGMDVAMFAACTGHQVILPASQQRVLDCAVKNRNAEDFGKCAAPELGIKLSKDQRVLVGCAEKSGGDTQAFAECAGSNFVSDNLGEKEKAIIECAADGSDLDGFVGCIAPHVLERDQQAILKCAIESGSAANFATCAASNPGVKMSDEQRVAVKCAAQSNGDTSAFASCAGSAFLGQNLGEKEQAVLNCAANQSGDAAEFASCAAAGLFGDQMSEEQKIAIKCAAQSQGDPAGMGTCAAANMFGMQLNPEQQIAVQCVVSTGGQPYAAAGCMASRLTARELTKCLSEGVGGKGCFGDSNDLVGKDGWVRRNMAGIAGGPNSVFNNPDQIWGGDNSFVRNPHQIFGGSNSFVRNPSQIWGGQNSVFNNPGQLLPQPKPVELGTVGGKRICLPWC